MLKRVTTRLWNSPSTLLVLCGIFWGGNAIASRLAVGQVTPLTLVFLRWVLVLAVLWPIYGSEVRAHWPEIRKKLPLIILMASLGFTAFNVLFYVAGHYTTALNIGILQGSMPAFVMAGAFLVHGTRITLVQFLGVLITTIGVLVVATRGNPSTILDIDFNFGDVLMLVACGLYAAYTVALRSRPVMPGAPFFSLLALIAAYTSVPLIAFEAVAWGLELPTLNGVLITIFVAIFPSCLAQIFLLRGVDLIGPGRAGVYMNLVPIFAAILAVAVLGEPFALYHGIALALVISGILLAQRTPKPPKPIAASSRKTQARPQSNH
ncbi:MAG: DMT family transporter [Hyphomicrobiaceae bacterium]|nr:DMT family transporter [Hyphomicrobiaceae bacterium]